MLKSLRIVLYSVLESLVLRCKLTPTLLKYSFVHSLNEYLLGVYCELGILLGPSNTAVREIDHCLHGFTLSFDV